MKKFFVSMILCGSLLMSFTVQAADGGKVLSRLQQALQKEFAGASSVNWERLGKNDIYHATFVYNNELLNAFFDGDGGLVATGRNISAEGLPLLVGRSVKSKFCGYDVLNIVEYSAEGETSYLLTLENEKTRLIVRAYDSGSSIVFKKEKKNLSEKL